jgi:hypothetical protein
MSEYLDGEVCKKCNVNVSLLKLFLSVLSFVALVYYIKDKVRTTRATAATRERTERASEVGTSAKKAQCRALLFAPDPTPLDSLANKSSAAACMSEELANLRPSHPTHRR